MNKILIYDDYNSRIVRGGVIGTITQEIGNKALRHSYKIIEIMKRKDIIKYHILPWGIRGYRDLPDKPGVSEEQYQLTNQPSQTLTSAHVPKIIIMNKQIKKSTTLKELLQARNITFRIRKLTPRECFRLMDLKEKDIDKLMDGTISNSQLYKLAGNSICISPMKEIFRQMFRPDGNHYQKPTDLQPEFDFGDDF